MSAVPDPVAELAELYGIPDPRDTDPPAEGPIAVVADAVGDAVEAVSDAVSDVLTGAQTAAANAWAAPWNALGRGAQTATAVVLLQVVLGLVVIGGTVWAASTPAGRKARKAWGLA